MQRAISVANMGYAVEYPTQCPICHHHGDIQLIKNEVVKNGKNVEIIYKCPFIECQRYFIGIYGGLREPGLKQLIPSLPDISEFPDIIKEISPEFVNIFIQAENARHLKLDQIAGPGFRKAFEFLIKDYAKSVVTPDSHGKIDKLFSGQVITDYIKDPRVQKVAERALWLGNDETHYLRKWLDKDINDLLILIRLTISWIEIEKLSEEYLKDMSGKK